jgi:dTDP-4-dehydrorhamnose reductase
MAKAKAVIRPTTSEKFVRPAERPKYSVLSSKSLEQRKIYMPTWQEGLQDYLAERGP